MLFQKLNNQIIYGGKCTIPLGDAGNGFSVKLSVFTL